MTTRIEWAANPDGTRGEVWNPTTGCDRVSEGCAHCYAARMAKRLKGMGSPGYEHGFKVTLHPERLNLPLYWWKPRTVFVDSMGDLFHRDVPVIFTRRVFNTMCLASWHRFLVLTKRAYEMRHQLLHCEHLCVRDENRCHHILGPMPLKNVGLGVSVESAAYLDRLDDLWACPAAMRFVSCEPLLGPLNLMPWLRGEHHLSWVIVGGETGPGARPMHPDWARAIRDQCVEAGVPFFFKGMTRKASGDRLDGTIHHDCPAWLMER